MVTARDLGRNLSSLSRGTRTGGRVLDRTRSESDVSLDSTRPILFRNLRLPFPTGNFFPPHSTITHLFRITSSSDFGRKRGESLNVKLYGTDTPVFTEVDRVVISYRHSIIRDILLEVSIHGETVKLCNI